MSGATGSAASRQDPPLSVLSVPHAPKLAEGPVHRRCILNHHNGPYLHAALRVAHRIDLEDLAHQAGPGVLT